jgi:conjugal transfer pilus assembly protein TraW
MRNFKCVAALISAIVFSLGAEAKDFGKRGHSFSIAEQEFLLMIKERLQKLDMEKEREKMTALVKDRVENPPPVEGIAPARENRSFYFDPTYRLDKDVILPCGKMLYKAGTKVNPLEYEELNRRLLFIDSRAHAQIEWLKEQLAAPRQGETEDRVILVGGSVVKLKEDLGQEHKDKIYFDQKGEITTKFGIKASPALAAQEGLRLRIEEIKLTK